MSPVGRDGKGSQRDSLVLCAGRAWGLGGGSDYMNVWYSAGCGLERLDHWDSSFRSASQMERRSKLGAVVETGRRCVVNGRCFSRIVFVLF